MKKHIDLDNYDRKEQFKFFKDFEEPFFGLTTHLNCENIYNYCKKKKIPFFAYYLYSLQQPLWPTPKNLLHSLIINCETM